MFAFLMLLSTIPYLPFLVNKKPVTKIIKTNSPTMLPFFASKHVIELLAEEAKNKRFPITTG